jgi:hypothetical protein
MLLFIEFPSVNERFRVPGSRLNARTNKTELTISDINFSSFQNVKFS